MSKRNLYLLGLAVVVLIGLSLVQKTSHDRATSASDTDRILDAGFAAEDINRVLVASNADSTEVVLERLPDHWVARTAWSHPVDQRKLDELLEILDGLSGQYRSDNAEILADYGLGPDSEAVTVTLFGKEWEPVYTLEIGRKPDRGAGAFVRDPADSAVFLTGANVLGKLGMYAGPAVPEDKYFLDLKVFDCSREDIEAITLHDGDTILAMEKVFAAPDPAEGDTVAAAPVQPDRSTWEWVLVEPERRSLAKSKVDGIMNALTNVQAAGIDDPSAPMEDYGLWKARRRVEVALADGSEFELRIGDLRETDGQKNYFMMTSQDRTIWTLREYKVNQIFKTLDDLLPES
jgi:hypothetical protein